MIKKNYLIAIENEAIGNLTAVNVLKYMMECQGGMYHLDKVKTDEVNRKCKNMFEGTTFTVFKTNSHEMYHAIVHVRETNGRVEIYNVTSDDINHSHLDKTQMTEIIDAFKLFIGCAIIEKMNITNGDLLN